MVGTVVDVASGCGVASVGCARWEGVVWILGDEDVLVLPLKMVGAFLILQTQRKTTKTRMTMVAILACNSGWIRQVSTRPIRDNVREDIKGALKSRIERI